MRSQRVGARFVASALVSALLTVWFLVPVPGAAQVAGATLSGTVTDASGAVIPNATLSIRNTATGVETAVSTNADGLFTAPNLLPGSYDVTVSAPGFQTRVQSEVALTVGAQQVLNVTMQVGQQTQSVTVEGEAALVATTDATVGNLTDQRQMRELPLNGRNFEQLIQITPGVATMSGNSFLTSGFQGRAPQYSVAGSRPSGQAILLDGENLQNYWNKGMGSVAGTSLGVEAIAEFQTLTNTYGAQFGGHGAVINAVSKSGTNGFHGSAYDFVRNNVFDAWDTFAKIPTTPSQPAYRQNQFGGSLGGPIKKDRTFFFVDYEGYRKIQGNTFVATIPTACELGRVACNGVEQLGNFSDINTPI